MAVIPPPNHNEIMGISPYLRVIGRGREGARALSREQAADLMGMVLDNRCTDLELGAFCLAMRVKGEAPEEMAGFLDAVGERMTHLPGSDRPVVVLPSYNGARKLPVLTPLLGLMLARKGLPVLIHGTATEDARVTSQDALAVIGITAQSPHQAIAPGRLHFVDTHDLLPGLKRLLDVRRTIGLRNSAHSLVKLMNPVAGPALVVGSYTHPAFGTVMTELFALLGQTALLSRGLEGEVVCDPRRTPQLDGFVRGTQLELQAQEPGTACDVPGLPQDITIEATADYTRRVLAGALPVPDSIATQVRHIVQLSTQASLP